MPDTSYEFLTKFFVEYLPFTPTQAQIDRFQNDLALVSPFLMDASLREAQAGVVGNILVYTPHEWRSAIFRIYNRKVAEHAQLFPIFHTFETAFRSMTAVALERHYNHARWWAGVNTAIRSGQPPHSVKQIGGIVLTRDGADAIGKITQSLTASNVAVASLRNGYHLVECCDLHHIRLLIEKHWPLFGPTFVRGTDRLSVADFRAKFDRVREARNDIYHHKSTARMKDVVATAEDLLDYVNLSLKFVFSKIKEASPVAHSFAIAVLPRHQAW